MEGESQFIAGRASRQPGAAIKVSVNRHLLTTQQLVLDMSLDLEMSVMIVSFLCS